MGIFPVDKLDKISFSGSLLGVVFSVTMEKLDGDTGRITGMTYQPSGDLPIDITLVVKDEEVSASGTLMGNPFIVRGDV